MPNRDHDAGRAAPKTDDTAELSKLHGLDRSGMGDKGWAEVPSDRIGGHPELESAPNPEAGGGINGPQPDTDRATGGAKAPERETRSKPRA
jgi:hypothetical protein